MTSGHQAAQHPDGVTDRRTRQAGPVAEGLVARELAHLAADRPVRVHHSLGVRRRPRRARDQGGAVGIDRHRAVDGLGGAQVVERDEAFAVSGVLPHADDHTLQVRQPVTDRRQLRQEVALSDAGHDDEHPGPALAEDEADLLGP